MYIYIYIYIHTYYRYVHRHIPGSKQTLEAEAEELPRRERRAACRLLREGGPQYNRIHMDYYYYYHYYG